MKKKYDDFLDEPDEPYIPMKKTLTYSEIYKILKKKIQKDFGESCRDFVLGCGVCQAHLMLQILQGMADDEQ